ncbi:MAG: peptidoglycan DD-metalloendopeptidase family protein [bacterium]|nr:peptidoglycan DD-metalloendopeptidase family protein [bacterium]
MRFFRRTLMLLALMLLALMLLAGCASRHSPVVVERSLSGASATEHKVVAGETLYAIALRYDKDYRELAQLNALDQNFTIHPGQRLRLRAAAATPPVKTGKVSPASPGPRPAKRAAGGAMPGENKTFVVKNPVPIPANIPPVTEASRPSASLAWVWPAKGALIGSFGSQGVTGKGLDISGKRGDSVLAAASGTVVYAGSGLVGYGKMLIVRHDDNYISAYAHNDRFLVKEGDRVTAGQTVAVMGSTGTDREKLHFEIRERGKPVDPLRFLPASR